MDILERIREEFTLPVIKKNANKEIKGNSYKG